MKININSYSTFKLLIIGSIAIFGLIFFLMTKILDVNNRVDHINSSINIKTSQNKNINTKYTKNTPYRIVYSESETKEFIHYLSNYFLLKVSLKDDYYKVSGRFYEVVSFIRYVQNINKIDRPDINFKAIKINKNQAEVLLKI